MTVAKWTQPDFTSQLASTYKGNIDAAFAVAARVVDAFAPHEQDTPDMTVRIDAGFIWNPGTLSLGDVVAQDSPALTAPTVNPKIVRVILDELTGTAELLDGTEGVIPSAPALTPGKIPVCQVRLEVGQTEVTNADLTDERVMQFGPQSSFTTGDVKTTLKAVADNGWVMLNDGSIGDASSGASRANADTSALFALLWNNVSNTYCVVQDNTGTPVSRGASAAADFAAHRRITLPKVLGRALAGAGAGSGLTSRALGQTIGEESHALTTAELASHPHGLSGSTGGDSNDHGHNYDKPTANAVATSGGSQGFFTGTTPTASAGANAFHSHSLSGNTQNAGSGSAHNNMQPTVFFNFMIKL